MPKILLVLLVGLVICSSQSKKIFEKDGEIIKVDSKNFKDVMDQYDNVFVKFFAPWCSHCKEMYQEWKNAAEQAKTEKIDVVFAEIDATVEKDLASQYGVQGFPTIKFFKKSSMAPLDYQGQRNAKDFVEFAKNNLDKIAKITSDNGNTYSKINDIVRLTGANHDSAIKDFNRICVQYFKQCNKCQLFPAKWTRMAKDFDRDKVIIAELSCKNDPSLCQQYTKFPTFVCYENGEKLDYFQSKDAKKKIDLAELRVFIKKTYKIIGKDEEVKASEEKAEKSSTEL